MGGSVTRPTLSDGRVDGRDFVGQPPLLLPRLVGGIDAIDEMHRAHRVGRAAVDDGGVGQYGVGEFGDLVSP